MEEVRTKVLKILDKYIFDKSIWNNVPENPKIITDLKINSARVVDIIIDIEEEFDVVIDNKTLEKAISLNDILSIINDKK
jgi:acyl carrier protein